MRFQKLHAWFCSVAFLLLFASITFGQQFTVYDNFGPGQEGWDYNYGLGWTIAGEDVPAQYGVEQANEFASIYDGVVTDIWVAISRVPPSTPADTVTIRLTENPSGQPPTEADIMEEWTLTGFGTWSQWNTPFHLEGNGTSQLLEGHSYWLWAIAEETTWCMWCMNEDPSLTIPHTIRREDEDWLPIGQETAAAFWVDVSLGTVGLENTTVVDNDNSLSQNYPNPFKTNTSISYSITKPGIVTLNIYDIFGKEIQTLVSEFKDTGNYSVDFNPAFLTTGIYLYKLQVGNQVVDMKKMSYVE